MKQSIYSAALMALVACNNSTNPVPETTDQQEGITVAEATEPFEKVEFESLDSLLISANLYEVDPDFPIMVLCHQAKFCKHEYAGIAERFNELGFNCLAIDQRSGGPIANETNETWQRALDQKKNTDYLDAKQDIEAAINYAFEKYGKPVILVGSSYSSTLCVYQAIENDKVASVIAFSPGNYFANELGDLTEKMRTMEKPFFLTAAKNEMPYVRELVLGRQRTENQIVFSPEGEGMHGARILWPTQQGGEEYWEAIEDFLNNVKMSESIQ